MTKLSYEHFTHGNSDNIDKAIKGLDIFTKNWCMNCKETIEKEDLVFRCKECNFEDKDGRCTIKTFVIDKSGNIPKDFGCMGSH